MKKDSLQGKSFNIHSNVIIKCLDKNKKIIKNIEIHNKATVNLVEGVLRFLRGDFSSSNYGQGTGDDYRYMPYEVRFGHVGVIMADRDTDYPRLVGIDESIIKIPTFNDYKLQEEIAANRDRFAMTRVKFESIDIGNYDDTNNSMSLILHAYIPPGQLVGLNDGYDEHDVPKRVHFTDNFVKDSSDLRDGQGWSYWNPYTKEWEAIFTEIGLFSKDGTMLARVVFNGGIEVNYHDSGSEDSEDGKITFDDENSNNNPIIQSDSSSILIDWVIGIVSVGQNDEIVTGAELNNFGMGTGLTAEEINDRISGYTSPVAEGEIIGLVNQISILVDFYISNTGDDFELDGIGVSELINARDSLNDLINKLSINQNNS